MNLQSLTSSKVAVGALCAILSGTLGVLCLLSDSPAFVGLRAASYNTLHRWAPRFEELASRSPVAMVYLDLNSHLEAKQDPKEAWPRALHAQLIRRLTAAGARAIVFDVVFEGQSPDPVAEKQLVEAIRGSGRVILAAELKRFSQNSGGATWVRGTQLVLPESNLLNVASGWGVAALRRDDDFIVRQHLAGYLSEERPTLTWKTAQLLGLPVTRLDRFGSQERWVRYYGPPLSIPHYSYLHALNPAATPDAFFQGKVVFVGARPAAGFFGDRGDEMRSPFEAWNRRLDRFMPAVEVHATEMLNLIRGDWLKRLSPVQEVALILAFSLVYGMGLIWFRPLAATLVLVTTGLGVLGGALIAFQSPGIWFPWLIVCAVQAPIALFTSILFRFAEWYRERQRLEAARRIDEAKIREQAALLGKAHDAILVKSLDGKVLFANPAAVELLGWSWEEVQGPSAASELLLEPTAHEQTLRTGDWTGEIQLVRKDGKKVVVASRWSLIRGAQGEPTGMLLINTDITEKKELEAQFLRSQRLDSIGALAGGMAHDLNNALSPILMGVELLRRKASDDEARRILGLIESSTHRGADMVRQVLLFARGKGGELVEVALGPLLKEMEKMARETFPRTIQIEAFIAEDLWTVRGHPTELHQVLLNLCVNSRDAMPKGGRLSIAADNLKLSEEEVSMFPGATVGDYVSLLVSDTGEGMPPEVRARIFEPFFTTKTQGSGSGSGSGIGLSTVLRIVKNHGGFVRVDSTPGQGTTFEILIPRATPIPQSPSSNQVVPEDVRGHGECILVVDDEQAIREMVAEGLEANGYRVRIAAHGMEGLQTFQEHADEIRLVLTDVDMPLLTGIELMQQVRAHTPPIPVILASGDGGGDIRQISEAQSPGIQWISKPITFEVLLPVVAALVLGRDPA